MKLNVEKIKDTQAIFEIEASPEELRKIKAKVLAQLTPKVRITGFRDGKAPLEMVEKSIDQQALQTEFLNEAINMLYIAVLKDQTVRPVGQPKVDVKKFVPFTTLEIRLELPVIGTITMPKYKKHGIKQVVPVLDKNAVQEVLKNLQMRSAEKKEVSRAAKKGDEAVIDFKGTDKDGKPVAGADGTDYPLALGSNTFIPGFEDGVVGMKIGQKKDLKLTFPKNYGSKDLQNKEVTFAVTLKRVSEVVEPKLDDKFASTVGPFESLEQLKGDIKKQLEADNKQRSDRDYESKIINELADKTKVTIPDSLIDEQKDMILQEVRKSVTQKGLTFEQYLEQISTTEEKYTKSEVLPEAIRRVKAGLLLSEIADKEGIDVTPEELEARMLQLKAQYPDAKMQEELDKPENRREINARLRSEKAINYLKDQA